MSSRRDGPRDSASRMRASGSSAMPTGTLIQKIQCQSSPCTTAPPASGPIATPSPLTPLQIPSAMPRPCGGVASDSSVSVSGKTIAAPAPCTARAAISMAVSGDRAAAALAAVKTASPMTNIRRRPKRSPSAAPVRSSTANVSV